MTNANGAKFLRPQLNGNGVFIEREFQVLGTETTAKVRLEADSIRRFLRQTFARLTISYDGTPCAYGKNE